ncbi:glycosyltransferase family 4 protein [Pseudomonas sp. EYE_354]|uniref:MraY family glycosyltransferase n=1 Tax=Pseudomonas sp. EYE_354 TaxID=2853449 RepID=UPI0020031829|nr:glycosyltransferase family 4 protein [Pseudomonas sp. EYE_354]MCK6186790.1 glycosyltransferase family 4 protein [Pseudomonas sp. EYE_354]
MNYWICFLIMVASWLLTIFFRNYALSKDILDIPNERSSHILPTPRGGGVAIVITFIIALIFFYFLDNIVLDYFIGLLVSSVLVASVGFIDDKVNLSARWRLIGHFVAAIWALFWIDGLPIIDFFGFEIELGIVGSLLAVFYLVWMLNLYNFMDGIDGIASLEAICVCLGMCIVYQLTGAQELMLLPLSLAMAVVGFLFLNFPPAKIFMGDAGSGFLGFVLGLFSLHAAWYSPKFFWCWLILLAVFITDATITLIRRFFRGLKVHEAHRSHAYQFASRRLGSHLAVSLAVCAINILWLLPISIFVALDLVEGTTGLALAYIPLVLLTINFDAGKDEAR